MNLQPTEYLFVVMWLIVILIFSMVAYCFLSAIIDTTTFCIDNTPKNMQSVDFFLGSSCTYESKADQPYKECKIYFDKTQNHGTLITFNGCG